MSYITSQSTTQHWPGLGWIRWLRVSFSVASVIIGLVSLAAVWEVGNNWQETGDWLVAIYQSDWFRLAVVGLIVWGYWIYRLKGYRPTVNNKASFLAYLDRPSRRIFWQALIFHYQDHSPELALGHIIQALRGYPGFRLAMVRLNISQIEVDQLIQAVMKEAAQPALVKAFALATAEAAQVDWSHLIKGAFQSSDSFSQFLDQRKIKIAEAEAVVNWTKKSLGYRESRLSAGLWHDLLAPKKNLNKTWTAKPTPVLDRYSKNLTDLAKLGFLTSAKVRQKEVEEAVQILSKSQQNSLIMVGEPGVGKTSVVGEIALRILQGDIPALKDYKLISLDLGAMLGGGENDFQQLFSRAVQEAALSGNTILFVGNLDQLGKAKSGEGFDLSAILLDALQNNRLQLIGTSDPLNYKKYIENNANLVTWFSRVNIAELDSDNAILVLEDLSENIEARQKVLVTLSAVKAAVQLSQQYIHTGKLPDKAEDLLDEAAVYAARRAIRLITDVEVNAVMSGKTNVPIGEIDKTEKTKLSDLADKIHQRLIGQNEAVTAVVEALKRARLGVSASGKRPIGTFLFLGPTGVGKTELAKALAWAYFGDETKIIRLDMGEYQTRESAHNLLGAPAAAGDIALAGGSFTEKIKQMPFAVVLLDEIEKAHPEILNVFLRVLDEGKMTDNLGNEVDFTHTIIIATSNAEARFIEEGVRTQLPYTEMQDQLIERITQTSFKPEFVNRFDGVIVFKPLQLSEIEQIARLKLAQLQQRLKVNKQIELQISDEAIQALAERGFEPAFGARPLERLIREKIESKVANALLADDQAQTIVVDKSDII
ncbi:MAG: ATP-dependent Clp protease ATP-binding subunit [Patescibacteria group bacterium]